MSPTIPRPAFALALALCGATGLACTSDDLIAGTEVQTATTYVDPTETFPFTTGEPEDSTSTGEMPSEQSCEQAVTCITKCAIELPMGVPEQDYSCFLPCVDGMSTEQWLALIEIGECVYNFCTATAKCPDVDDEMTCTGCLLFSLQQDPGVMGCEMQAMACE
ncbi:MAG TPA: hypothetical protein VGB85_06100 [Nannocystis sp.]|jgi:hypothetical protein